MSIPLQSVFILSVTDLSKWTSTYSYCCLLFLDLADDPTKLWSAKRIEFSDVGMDRVGGRAGGRCLMRLWYVKLPWAKALLNRFFHALVKKCKNMPSTSHKTKVTALDITYLHLLITGTDRQTDRYCRQTDGQTNTWIAGEMDEQTGRQTQRKDKHTDGKTTTDNR